MGMTRLEPGQVFAGDFEVLRPLAEGGMGAVYVARQRSTGHDRALKIMHPQFALDAASRAKFEQEARVGARVESDHVVQVVAAGVDTATGTPWLAMELLRGEDLASLVKRRGALPPHEAREVLAQLGHAVAAAHRIGLVHRDLKPENIFVAESRRTDAAFTLKVLDFGIAKVLQENRTAATATMAMGSPLWMAPEQTERDGRIAPATDVWALGLVAFFALTGRNYWLAANAAAPTVQSLLREMLFEALEPASSRAARLGAAGTVPPAFDAWFARCVAREPAQRFRDAGEAMATLGGVWANPMAWTAPSGPSPATTLAALPPVPPRPQPAPTPVALIALAAVGALAVVVGAPALLLVRARTRAEAQRQEALETLRGEQEEQRLEALRRYAEAQEARAGARDAGARSARYVIRNNGAPPHLARDGGATRGVFAALDTEGGGAPAPTARETEPPLIRERTVQPRVRATPPQVTGLLSPEAIRRVVLRNLGQVNHCYEQGLAQNPTLAGRVTVRFVIGGAGTVLSSGVGESTLALPSVGECVARAVRRWQFPAPEGGGVVTVSYPFTFSASG